MSITVNSALQRAFSGFRIQPIVVAVLIGEGIGTMLEPLVTPATYALLALIGSVVRAARVDWIVTWGWSAGWWSPYATQTVLLGVVLICLGLWLGSQNLRVKNTS